MASTAGGEGPKQPSERTYGQRFLKALGIYNLVKDDAAYDPQGNDLITKAAFKAVVDKLGAANQTVADLEPVYDGAQDKRLALYFGPEGLRKRVSMVRAVIGGLKVGKSSTAFLTVQRIGQEMVNYQKPAKEVANGTDPKRSTAQMSFGSLLLKGQEVLGVMKDMKGTYEVVSVCRTECGRIFPIPMPHSRQPLAHRPPDKRRKYDEAFKTEALRLAAESRSTSAAARQVGLNTKLFYRWQ
jgi:hypothetical protein